MKKVSRHKKKKKKKRKRKKKRPDQTVIVNQKNQPRQRKAATK